MIETSTRLTAVSGLVHGFTTRLGGVSVERYASLNMGGKWGDDPAAVEENVRRVGTTGGFDPGALRRVRQVHGADVVAVDTADGHTEADGLWCGREHRAVVAVLTADCVPILLADLDGRVAGAVHSGWRGTVANIVGAAVDVLGAVVSPSRLLAAIGPCIETDAFEVSEDVAGQFAPRFVTTEGYAKPHVDLVSAVRSQLVEAGVPSANVERIGGCTHANPDRYFSYRRDGAGIGQMMSFIGFPAREAG